MKKLLYLCVLLAGIQLIGCEAPPLLQTMAAQTTEDAESDTDAAATAAPETDEPRPICDAIRLSCEKDTLLPGENVQIDYAMEPENCRDVPIFSSTDESVLQIDSDGRVTAVGSGEASILVISSFGRRTDSLHFSVYVPPESIKLPDETTRLIEGDSVQLDIRLRPQGSLASSFTWTSSNERVARVDPNGTVTALERGMSLITATSADGTISDRCKVQVAAREEPSLTFDRGSMQCAPGETFQIQANFSNSADTTLHWYSEDPSVARVNKSGCVTAVSSGKTLIYAKNTQGLRAECAVEVLVRAQKLHADQLEYTLYIGESVTPKIRISPGNVTYTSVFYESSNSFVASVQKGVIYANHAGEASVTVTSYDGAASLKIQLHIRNKTYRVLRVPFIHQIPKYPHGCEFVSATMALQSAGIDISVEDFLEYLDLGEYPHTENGVYYGHDPNKVFAGNPRSTQSWGCYAPVISSAIRKFLDVKTYELEEMYGVSLDDLCKKYIDKGIPVIIWATISMREPYYFTSWTVKESGETVVWNEPEHCLVLTGYDDLYYYFNDPLKGASCAYARKRVETAYSGMGSQAIIVKKK